MSVAERHMHANMLVVLVVLLGSEQPEVQLLRGLLRRRHELHRIVQPVASLFVRARPWPELRAPTRVSQYVVALMLDLPGFSEFGRSSRRLWNSGCPDICVEQCTRTCLPRHSRKRQCATGRAG